jgi:hypothetical protein
MRAEALEWEIVCGEFQRWMGRSAAGTGQAVPGDRTRRRGLELDSLALCKSLPDVLPSRESDSVIVSRRRRTHRSTTMPVQLTAEGLPRLYTRPLPSLREVLNGCIVTVDSQGVRVAVRSADDVQVFSARVRRRVGLEVHEGDGRAAEAQVIASHTSCVFVQERWSRYVRRSE